MPHATQEVIEPDFRIRCWRHQDSQTHWEVFLKKRAFSQGDASKRHPQTSPGPSTKQGERIFTSKNFRFGNEAAPASDSFLVLAAKLSWGPGCCQSARAGSAMPGAAACGAAAVCPRLGPVLGSLEGALLSLLL